MPRETNCPNCGSNIRIGSMKFGHSFKPYHVCPDCRAKFTTDTRTKERVVLIAIFALVTAGISTAGFIAGFPWGLVAAFSGIGLLIFSGYTLSKIRYVEYHDKRDT